MTCNFLFCYLVYRGEHGEFKVTDPRANATNDLQCKVLSPKSPHVVYYCWYTRFMARFQRIRGLFDSAMLLKLMIQLVLNKPRLRFQCLFIVRGSFWSARCTRACVQASAVKVNALPRHPMAIQSLSRRWPFMTEYTTLLFIYQLPEVDIQNNCLIDV